MITADALARELGCTLTDLADLTDFPAAILPNDTFNDPWAAEIRTAWLASQTGYEQ